MTVKPVLILGDACVDLMVKIPQKGGSQRQHPPPELHGGGTAANTAVALARLDIPTAFMGTVGNDSFGRFAVNTLVAEGIDTRHIITCDAFTVQTLALIDAEGERTLLGYPRRGGAHTHLSPDHITADIINTMAWLHTSGMCLVESPSREAMLRAMELAQAAKIPVSFDINLRLGFEDGKLPETFLKTVWRTIALADFVFGSFTDELVYLTQADSYAAAAAALTQGQRTVIARLGDQGAYVVSAEGESALIPTFPVKIVDTLGAGDVFNAGFIAALLESKSLPAAVRWGNATAALKITQPGARSSPRREEVEALLAKKI